MLDVKFSNKNKISKNHPQREKNQELVGTVPLPLCREDHRGLIAGAREKTKLPKNNSFSRPRPIQTLFQYQVLLTLFLNAFAKIKRNDAITGTRVHD